MKTTRLMTVLAAALAVSLGTLAPTPALADGGYYKPHYPAAGYKRYGKPGYAPGYYGGNRYYRTGGYYRGYYGGGGTRYNFVIGVGPGFWGPGYYAPYYGPSYYGPYAYPYPAYPYYPPAVVAAPSSPPTYIEKGAPDEGAAPAQSAYWYYCRDANGYYPYVKQCPGGWERVAPQPPPER